MGLRHTVSEVVAWLQAGYPQGVPSSDRVALLGILRRRLSDAELEDVAGQVVATATQPTSVEQIRELLRSTTLQEASEDDVRRVSAILVMGGWPLAGMQGPDEVDVRDGQPGGVVESVDSEQDAAAVAAAGHEAVEGAAAPSRPNPITRFVEWIRLGYPGGVPDQDYQPLLALLHKRLSDEEVEEVARALVGAGMASVDRVDVGVEVSKMLNGLPTSDEVGRVLDRLQAVGWPILDDGLED